LGQSLLDPSVRGVERATVSAPRAMLFEADEFERMDADRLENCLQAGRQKIGLHRRTRHIAAARWR
jgi:hypothetical protein